MDNKTIVIVDGNSLINRAYFAMRELKNSKGIYTGGVHGLMSMVLNLQERFEPSHFCVAFDLKGPTFRHQTYEAYKGTRKGMPDELAMQMPIVKELLDVLKLPRVEFQGFEADDLIGTIACRYRSEGYAVHVITGDKDALQLVAHGVDVYITKKGISQLKHYTDADVYEELGVHANQVIDFKGLSGDASDNIPGIPGIGPKTASKLLETFGTVEQLIQSSDAIENKRQRGLVETYEEQALLSKRLATICTEVPIEYTLEDFQIGKPDYAEVVERFGYYELKSLMQKVQGEQSEALQTETVDFKCVEVDTLAAHLAQVPEVVISVCADGKWQEAFEVQSIGFKTKDAVYLLEKPSREALRALKPHFENEALKKYAFDVKPLYLYLMALDIELKGVVFDGTIASYLLEPDQKTYAVDDIFLNYLSGHILSEEQLLGKGAKKKAYGDIPKEELAAYNASVLCAVDALGTVLKEKLEEKGSYKLFETVEVPLVKVLAEVEFNGFKVDTQALDKIDAQLKEQIGTIEKTIYDLAGRTFNINSPKQLGVVLFEELGLTPIKKTKTGYSTSHDVLEKLMKDHAIIEEIIEYRTYTKLKSTYVDGLREVVVPETHRIHTSLNQTVAATGRLSSTEPNLQNIPIRLPYGRKIRKFFVADADSVLVAADYSQIELRVLAHLSKDETLINAFMNDVDIHTLTASQVFGIAKEAVNGGQRSHAKEVNFGIVYGMGDFGLSESLRITRKEAKNYIESYFKTYPRVQAFMDEVIADCHEKGYVSTVLGRTRSVPDINNKNFMIRSGAERVARNTPIQGSAADIIKLAMLKVQTALKEGGYKSRMILQVHDELILNVLESERSAVEALLKNCMEAAYQLEVPLKVDVNSGRSWYDVK